ncbi:MAG: YicC/YloC family endoribonuclease [Acidobacteriota bacterium]
MIKSMTGFGQGRAEGRDYKVRVDVRSVNNRFLDVHTKLPPELSSLEMQLKKQVQAALKRGRVDVTVSVEQMKQAVFEINRPLVSGYLAALAELRSEFGLAGEPSLELVAKLQGALVVSQDSTQLDEELVQAVSAALEESLASLIQMRASEGQELARELNSRLSVIESQLPGIETEAERLPAIYRERLEKRLQEIAGEAKIDEMRLAQEVVMFVDRSDISEEIARLRSHIVQMRDILASEDDVGKRLDFILQEMNREASTILSKSGDLAISDAAIVIKTEVEKLREQVQNVE